MRKSISRFISVFLLLSVIFTNQAIALELTQDNPATIISAKSEDMSIYGLRLGMTHEQAWSILKESNLIVGEIDDANPSRIYVCKRNNDGSIGDSVLYLIWNKNQENLNEIVIYQNFRANLTSNFQLLLTFEALDNSSKFKKQFIGYESRKKTELDIPSIKLKTIAYIYEKIGLTVTHYHSSDEEKVYFSIIESKP
jgi:hypothetical protein